MRKIYILNIMLLLLLILSSCSIGEFFIKDYEENKSKDGYEIAVVTDVGQLYDGGFNEETYKGVKLYAGMHGKTYNYYQIANGFDATDNDRISAMRLAIENGAKVIVTPGFLQCEAIMTVANENPDVKFIFVDGWDLGLENVYALRFAEEQAGFLAGYAAVKDGYRNLGGVFGGGGSNAACNRYAYGYVQGIAYAANELDLENVQVRISYQYGSTFSASTELQTQMNSWYSDGVEIVFCCGASMLQSVKAAAEETRNGKIIGVDVNQSSESERIVFSALKNMSNAVQYLLFQLYNNNVYFHDVRYGLEDEVNAIGLYYDEDSWRFNSFTIEECSVIENRIRNGVIHVLIGYPDMNDLNAWNPIITNRISFTLEN